MMIVGNWVGKLLCWLGIHSWFYYYHHSERVCRRCEWYQTLLENIDTGHARWTDHWPRQE